jgi:NADPH2 dehydrogenase
VESTAVSANGRLFKDDIGLYSDAHVAPMRRVADAVHAHGVPLIVQLSHGGRKSNPPAGAELLGPSPLPFDDGSEVPRAMDATDIARAVDEFASAARRAMAAGFDGVELHAAHGYLLHQFLSPLSNLRTDAYGATAEGRLRLTAEVLRAVREVVGSSSTVTLRVSASDYVEGGLTPSSIAAAVRSLTPLGLDGVHVSSGGLLPLAPESSHPGYQVAWAGAIKREVSVPVIAVGGLHRRSLIEEVLQQGHADLIAIGRPILERPDFMTDKLASTQFDG